MSEKWCWVEGYEHRYMISDHGNIKSFCECAEGQILSMVNKNGDYFRLPLVDCNGVRKTFLVHRLVASTFIGEIPSGYQVHHIDGNKQNNRASNLVIINAKEHFQKTIKGNPSLLDGMVNYNKNVRPRKVEQYTKNGKYVATYANAITAEQATGVCHRNILQVANKTPFNKQKGFTRKQAGGFVWKFAEESEVMPSEF